jgi:hypothetical protein
MSVPIKKAKLHNLVFKNIESIKRPEDLTPAETDPEIIPFEDPFESPPDDAAIPGEGP